MRLKNWTKYSAEQLWESWRGDFTSDDDAIAHAVWCANRLCKSKGKAGRRRFYSIKNKFISLHAEEGRAIRQEVLYCNACGGVDTSDEPEPCRYCGGSGIYRSRWLYSYCFEVAGQAYSFHGFIEPKKLITSGAFDSGERGGKFTEEEIRAMRLPWSGLLKMLGYVAVVKLGMVYDYDYGEYITPSASLVQEMISPGEAQRREMTKINAELVQGISHQRAIELRLVYGVK